jgi:hypothetical protein
LVEDGDPMLDGAEDGAWVKVGKADAETRVVDAPVEEATAVPGEKRSTGRGKSSK